MRLAARWPAAQIRGIDNSEAMIAAAHAAADTSNGRVSFELGDVTEWEPDSPADVIISNAVLQWIPDHLRVLTRWAGLVSSGGWLAIQVPGNFDQPSHVVLRELAASRRWRRALADVKLNRSVADPAQFGDLLAGQGFDVDAWETTYLHVLQGEDPVVAWYSGTGLRPVLTALAPAEATEFLSEYREKIGRAYPAASYGTPFPFRRVFAVAHRRRG